MLFKNHPAVLAGDHGGAQFPLNLAEWVDAGAAEKTLQRQAGARCCLGTFRCFWWFFIESRHRHIPAAIVPSSSSAAPNSSINR